MFISPIDIKIIEPSEPIELIINGIPCIEIMHEDFIVSGKDNPFPFLKCVWNSIHEHYKYKSIFVSGKFYAPKMK